MNFIEFDYETVDGQIVLIEGKTDFKTAEFKVFDKDYNPIKKSKLTQHDLNVIQDLIFENTEPEINYESDFYNRYDD
jgi:hypothetical protein